MTSFDLTDEQWEKVRLFIPEPHRLGRSRADDRRTVNAILFVLRAHIPWNYLPAEYGDDTTANRRFREWRRKGVWERISAALELGSESQPNSQLGTPLQASATEGAGLVTKTYGLWPEYQ